MPSLFGHAAPISRQLADVPLLVTTQRRWVGGALVLWVDVVMILFLSLDARHANLAADGKRKARVIT